MCVIQDPLQIGIQFIVDPFTYPSLLEMKHNHVGSAHVNSRLSIQPMHLNVVRS